MEAYSKESLISLQIFTPHWIPTSGVISRVWNGTIISHDQKSLPIKVAVFIFPSQTKLNISYMLVALMLASGTALVLLNPVHITQTCLEGLGYLAFVGVGIIAARRKLAVTLNNHQ